VITLKNKKFAILGAVITIIMLISSNFIFIPYLVGGDDFEPMDDPIEIYTIDDLYAIRHNLSGNYILMNDLDFQNDSHYVNATASKTGNTTGSGWLPIGIFTGTFDGQGYIISNLFINRSSTNNVGLFGETSNTAIIENVGLLNVEVIGDANVGGLIGKNYGLVNKSFTKGTITGGISNRAGGLVGNQETGAQISNCYSEVIVNGIGFVGGFSGNNNGQFINCYSIGHITGNSDTGGFIGNSKGVVSNCFYDNETSGQSDTGKGTGKNTSDMQTITTFSNAGWDIALYGDWDGETWYIENPSDYPRLGWEYIPMDGWNNSCPVSSDESPTNRSTDVSLDVGYWNVTISDADGNATSGTIVCSNGDNASWNDQLNGTRSLPLSTLSYSTNYTIWLNFTDGHCNVNETFWFITMDKPIYSPIVSTLPATNVEETSAKLYGNLTDDGGEPCVVGFEYDDSNISYVVEKKVVWDNGENDGLNGAYNSQLDTSYPFNSQEADDFMFDNDTNITNVQWWGEFYSEGSFPNPGEFKIIFYADNGTGDMPTGAGMPDPTSTALIVYNFSSVMGTSYGTDRYYYNVELPIPFFAEKDIKYWMAVQFVGNYTTTGFWAWSSNGENPERLNISVVGFPILSIPYWTVNEYNSDMAFYLETEFYSTKSSDEEFNVTLTSFNPGTLYHYRAVATNSNSTTYGEDMYFLTKPLPIMDLSADTISNTSINISWTNTANSTYVERNTTASWERGEGVFLYNGTDEYFIDTGLDRATTYYYQAWSYAEWTVNPTLHQWSDDYDSDFANTDEEAPVVVTNGSSGVEETSATLHGFLVDSGDGSCKVWFEYGFNTSYGYISSNTTKATGEEFNISIISLNPGQIYHYRAVAQNSNSTVYGEDMYFLTKPLAPTNLTIIRVTSGFNLSWEHGIGYNKSVMRRLDNTTPEIFDVFNIGATGASGANGNTGAISDGTYLYSTRWASNLIHRYDFAGNLIEEFSISGVTGLRDLAFDGSYMYGGSAGGTIYKMDFSTKTLIDTITGSFVCRGIAYNNDLDIFYVTQWGDPVYIVNRQGQVLSQFTLPQLGGSVYGLAYDNTQGTPYLLYFVQNNAKIYQWDLTLNTTTDWIYDVGAKVGSGAGMAGGLSIGFYKNSYCIVGCVQDASAPGVTDWLFAFTYSRGTFPATPQEGIEIYNGTENTFIDENVTIGTIYCYSIWEYTEWDDLYQFSNNFITNYKIFAVDPTISTLPATDITTVSAKLWGNLTDDGGEPCKVWFEYGETEAYGNITSYQYKSSNESFSVNIFGLKHLTNYHYRAVAENSNGTAYGEDMMFLTRPYAPTNFTATTFNSVNLTWTKGIGAN
jgi:hypothetical protein